MADNISIFDFHFSSYLDNILEELAPNDVRTLIKAEEELNQTSHFTRLFPSPTSHKYFQYFYEGIPYYDKLLGKSISRKNLYIIFF